MKIDFQKGNGLIPAIVQDFTSLQVLMLGYMNEEAYHKTLSEGKVTFYSRSKQRLWTKGEESGHFLLVKEIFPDCDGDTLLIKAEPLGPTCHTGTFSCFGKEDAKGFIYTLENIIHKRIEHAQEKSYTYQLYQQGLNKIVQKVGEEAVELLIEAKDNSSELFKQEAADLLYHLLVLLRTKNVTLEEVETILHKRHK
jgi:phosphoribosyl-ATP pyrophosphohydrolase/phosphoribosyl-AMP cyclohydrolase